MKENRIDLTEVSSVEQIRNDMPTASEFLAEDLKKTNKAKRTKLAFILLAVTTLFLLGIIYVLLNKPLNTEVVKDTTVPTITVENGEFFYVRKGAPQYKGLTITDDTDAFEDLQIAFEGLDFESEGKQKVTVKVKDSSGNYTHLTTIAEVMPEKYKDGEEMKLRDFSDYTTVNLRSNPSADINFQYIETVSLNEVLEKLDNKETFALMLGFENCPWCQDAKPVFEKVLEQMNIKAYYIDTRNLDNIDCESACEVVDIRKSDDERFARLAQTSEREYIYVPYVITYKNGEKLDDFLTLDYNAHVRNINDDEIDELTKIYQDMMERLIAE